MKALILSLSILLPMLSHAAALDTPEAARRLKQRISAAIFSMDEVHMIGITGCHPRSGRPYLDGDFVHCVDIGTDSVETAALLLKRFPAGRKIDGVFVVVRLKGRAVAHPRMSGGR